MRKPRCASRQSLTTSVQEKTTVLSCVLRDDLKLMEQLPIVYSSNQTDKSPSGDWYGIVSYGNEGDVHMGYSSFNHYTNGVYTTGGQYVATRNNGDSIYIHHNSFYAGGDAFRSNATYSLNRPIVFLYNELHQCGIFDQGYTSYRKYEHNTIKAGAAYESFEFRQFIDQNANHSAYLSVSNNTFEKGRIYFWMVTSMTTLQLAYISITTPLEAAVTE